MNYDDYRDDDDRDYYQPAYHDNANPEAEDFFCEACQRNFFQGGFRARLNGGIALPVCVMCWKEIPVGQRVKIAADIRHHRTIAEAVNAAAGWLEFLRDILDRANDEEVAGGGDDGAEDVGILDQWAEEADGDGIGDDGFWLN